MKKKVMLYLEETEYNRLKSSADTAGKSMNAFVAGLIWNHDAVNKAVAEVSEFKCKRCDKTIWSDIWQAVPPSKCPWCNGELIDRGRWGTVVLGKVK